MQVRKKKRPSSHHFGGDSKPSGTRPTGNVRSGAGISSLPAPKSKSSSHSLGKASKGKHSSGAQPKGRASSGGKCLGCFQGCWTLLVDWSDVGDAGDEKDGIGGELAKWDLPPKKARPRPIVETTVIPANWNSPCPTDKHEKSQDDDGKMIRSESEPCIEYLDGMPSLRPSRSSPILEELDAGGRQGYLRLTSPAGARVEDQLIELRPNSVLELADLWQGSVAPDLTAAMSVVVVFEHLRYPETVIRHPLSYTMIGDEMRWSIPFHRTGMAFGMYRFHFDIDGARVLSNRYAVVGKSNVALFSDTLRRYIVARSKEKKLEHFQPKAAKEVEQTIKPQLLETSDVRMVSRRSRRQSIVEPRSSLLRRHSIQCIAHHLAETPDWLFTRGREDSGLGDGGTICSSLFSSDVYEDLYDAELHLRLNSDSLDLDWSAAPLGGPCTAVRFWAGSCRMSKHGGVCEDSCFVSSHAVGVADGVGGMSAYAHYGVDSALFASELMDVASKKLTTDHSSSSNGKPPIDHAAEAMDCAEKSVKSFGAATMIVGFVAGNMLGVANLGDSGFLLVRRERRRLEIVAQSKEQHHRWNCPFQLTRLPPSLAQRFPGFAKDTAADCETYDITLHDGDLLIFFSDGLRDNLHDHEILHIAECALPPAVSELVGLPSCKTAPESIAQALALAAYERSCDPRARVPFASYCREHGYDFDGGKEDDITVVVAWVARDAGPAKDPG